MNATICVFECEIGVYGSRRVYYIFNSKLSIQYMGKSLIYHEN